jgi:hypothetical protein
MVRNWLSAALVFGCLGWGPAKADVTYTFYDADNPSQIDLQFSVGAQLSGKNLEEGLIFPLGGAFGPDFSGDGLDAVARYSPNPYHAEVTFDDGQYGGRVFFFPEFTPGAPPGDGDFKVSGSIDLGQNVLAQLGSATISGIPVGAPAIPEPSTWLMLLLGAAGIMAASGAVRRRHDEALSRRATA